MSNRAISSELKTQGGTITSLLGDGDIVLLPTTTSGNGATGKVGINNSAPVTTLDITGSLSALHTKLAAGVLNNVTVGYAGLDGTQVWEQISAETACQVATTQLLELEGTGFSYNPTGGSSGRGQITWTASNGPTSLDTSYNFTGSGSERVLVKDQGTAGTAEDFSITARADASGDLDGDYWIFYTSYNTAYYVWYAVTGYSNTDPAPTAPTGVSYTGIQVSIATDATNTAVASATKSALDTYDFNEGQVTVALSGGSSEIITITNPNGGAVPDVSAGTSGFTSVTINTQGTGNRPDANGIWIRTTQDEWNRASDFDSNSEVQTGSNVLVSNGSANINKTFVLTYFGGILGGATGSSQVWEEGSLYNAQTITAVSSVSLDDNTFISGRASYNAVGGTGGRGALNATLITPGSFEVGGVSLSVGNRILLKNQENSYENGIYEVISLTGGTNSDEVDLARDAAFDADTDAQIGSYFGTGANRYVLTEYGGTMGGGDTIEGPSAGNFTTVNATGGALTNLFIDDCLIGSVTPGSASFTTVDIGTSLNITSGTTSTSSITGALTVAGGTGIAGALNIGGATDITDGTASTSTTTGALTVAGGTGIAGALNIGGATDITDGTASTSSSTGALTVTGGAGIGGDMYIGGSVNATTFDSETAEALQIGPATATSVVLGATDADVSIPSTTASSSTSTGALVVSGGMGVAGDVFVASNLDVAGGIRGAYAYLWDQKTQGTQGGGFTAGSWVTRTLNQLSTYPSGFVTRSGNDFTITLAGDYRIYASAPGYEVGNFTTQVYNVTGASTAIVGTSEFNLGSTAVQTRSVMEGIVSIGAATTFRIRMRSSATQSTNGAGVRANYQAEIYTRVYIEKLN
jgi:hypothetical protein